MGLASSVFVAGRENRLAFGVIDQNAGFLYGPTAVYVARTPESPAKGPSSPPPTCWSRTAPFRSRQAATEHDPFAAVYAARSRSRGRATTRSWRSPWSTAAHRGARPDHRRRARAATAIPAVGERAPRVETDTVASARGDLESIDTRVPPSPELHEDSLAERAGQAAGRAPVRHPAAVPVARVRPRGRRGAPAQGALRRPDAFIHQEVYVDNDPNKGVREPMRAFGLPTEPWLFVIGRDGRVTARLEGSFGLDAFERALKTAL